MSDLKLSTLSIILGLIVALPSAYGLLKPKAFAEAARKFPRHTPIGYVLMLLGTAWFLYFVSQEAVLEAEVGDDLELTAREDFARRIIGAVKDNGPRPGRHRRPQPLRIKQELRRFQRYEYGLRS